MQTTFKVGAFDRQYVGAHAVAEESDPAARRLIVWVIFNRARTNPARFGATPGAVCMKRYQFSEDLPDAVDNADMERVLSMAPDDPAAVDGLAAHDEVSAQVARGEKDPTGGALFFAARSIKPRWAYGTSGELLDGVTVSAEAGGTLFYLGVK